MAKKTNVAKEMKMLGIELVGALKQIKDSREFKDLEREVVNGIKRVSANLVSSLSAAKKSKTTAKIKRQFGKVVVAGKEEGKVQAEHASKVAMKKIAQVSKTLKRLSKEMNSKN